MGSRNIYRFLSFLSQCDERILEGKLALMQNAFYLPIWYSTAPHRCVFSPSPICCCVDDRSISQAPVFKAKMLSGDLDSVHTLFLSVVQKNKIICYQWWLSQAHPKINWHLLQTYHFWQRISRWQFLFNKKRQNINISFRIFFPLRICSVNTLLRFWKELSK